MGDLRILSSQVPPSQRKDYQMGEALVWFLLRQDCDWATTKASREDRLVKSASLGHLECTRILLLTDVDVNAVSPMNCHSTALVACSSVKVGRLLLEADADPDREASHCYHTCTPLKSATDPYKPEVIKLLIEYGADLERGFLGNDTVLAYAMRTGEKECIELLLELGADPRSLTRFGG